MNDGSGQSADSAAVSYHIPCQYRYLALIRDATLELGERLGLSDFDTYQLEMAVDEACTNIIEHGYGGERPPESDDPGIYVVFIEQERKITVEITDRGAEFDFGDHDVQSPKDFLTNQSERGLGMFIISAFVDEVTYHRDEQRGNVLRLTKAY